MLHAVQTGHAPRHREHSRTARHSSGEGELLSSSQQHADELNRCRGVPADRARLQDGRSAACCRSPPRAGALMSIRSTRAPPRRWKYRRTARWKDRLRPEKLGQKRGSIGCARPRASLLESAAQHTTPPAWRLVGNRDKAPPPRPERLALDGFRPPVASRRSGDRHRDPEGFGAKIAARPRRAFRPVARSVDKR